MKRILAFTLALTMLLLCAACGGAAPEPAKTEPQQPAAAPAAPSQPAAEQKTTEEAPAAGQSEYNPVEIHVNVDNLSLNGIDPQLSASTNSTFLYLFFNGLMRINEDSLLPECDLAESYEVSDDGMVYTFKLRHGVQFHHDYGEMTAEDVVFSLERAKSAEGSQFGRYYTMVDEIKALDDYTVQITLNSFFPNFIYYLTDGVQGAFISSKRAWDEVGDDGFAVQDYGTGPFVFDPDGWVLQQSSHYISFKDYFNGAPKVNVTISEIKDGNTALLALQKGELDFMLSSQLEAVTQAQASGMTVEMHEAPIMFALFFNSNVFPPFEDIRVRQAVCHAINRDANRQIVFGDYMARSVNGFMPDNLPGYTEEGITTYDYNPEKAKALLAEAGYPDGLEFTAVVQNNVRNERIFTLIQSNLKEVGIKLNVELVSTTEYYSAINSHSVAFGYSSVSGIPEMYFFLFNNLHTKGSRDYGDYAGCDELIDKAAATADLAERYEIYKEIQIQLSNDLALFPHHLVNVIMISQPHLKGVYSKGFNGGDLRFDKAYIEN